MLISQLDIRHDSDSTIEEKSITPEVIQEVIDKKNRILKRSEISGRLSMLGKTAAGDGYVYLKAACTNMNLIDISSFLSFKHLQFIDVSNNTLTTKSLQVLAEMPFLLLLQASNNNLKSAVIKKMKYLQVLILNNNMIDSVFNVYHPELSTLEIAYNRLSHIEFQTAMDSLKCIDFRFNKISEIAPLRNLKNLDSLYLAGNKITNLEGIGELANLRILHLRNNPLKKLNGFSAKNLKLCYINVRACQIDKRLQIKKLQVLPALVTIVLKGCPYMGGVGEERAGEDEEDAFIRSETLATLPKLLRLNKYIFTHEDRLEAKELLKTWIEGGEPEESEGEDTVDEEHVNEEAGEGQEQAA